MVEQVQRSQTYVGTAIDNISDIGFTQHALVLGVSEHLPDNVRVAAAGAVINRVGKPG
jgi:hypothetical protein